MLPHCVAGHSDSLWDLRENSAKREVIWPGGVITKIANPEIDKYHVVSRHHGYAVNKADPFGFMHETPPATASRRRSTDTAPLRGEQRPAA